MGSSPQIEQGQSSSSEEVVVEVLCRSSIAVCIELIDNEAVRVATELDADERALIAKLAVVALGQILTDVGTESEGLFTFSLTSTPRPRLGAGWAIVTVQVPLSPAVNEMGLQEKAVSPPEGTTRLRV